VFNVLLQVLDDGRLTDGQGHTVDFRNTLIVMTSNLGAEFLVSQPEGQDSDAVKDQVMAVVRASFRPEFLNRVDEIILFHRLKRNDMGRIVEIQVGRLRKLLEEGKVTWTRAKSICRAILAAEPGKEKAATEKALAALRREAKAGAPPRPLSYRTATRKLGEQIRKAPRASYTVAAEDLLSLLVLLHGKSFDETHVDRVRRAFPGLLD